MAKRHTWSAVWLVALLTGCPSDWDVMNKGAITTAQCEQAECNAQAYEGVPDGCTIIACGEDIGGTATSCQTTANIAPTEDGVCQVIVECEDTCASECDGIDDSCYCQWEQCKRDSNGDPGCNNEYADCELEDACEADRACEQAADLALEECLAQCDSPIAIPECEENCQIEYGLDIGVCECEEAACIAQETPDCYSGGAQLVSPPMQTGTQRWTVHRAFIDQQLARTAALQTETGAWPVLTPTGQWSGIRLSSIQVGDPLRLLGVRDNDVLTSINGVPIGQALQNPSQLLALRNASTILVGLKRGGVAKQFRYDVVP